MMIEQLPSIKENLCNQCPTSIRGSCCYRHHRILDSKKCIRIRLTNTRCKYLNPKTGRCKVYNKRFEKNPNCLTLEEMYKLGTLPRDCPYVKNDSSYQQREDLVFPSFKEFKETYPYIEEETIQEIKEEYDEIDKFYENEDYSTLTDHFCPQCESYRYLLEWKDKFSIIYFEYKCLECGYKWNTFQKQVKYTLQLLKQSQKKKL